MLAYFTSFIALSLCVTHACGLGVSPVPRLFPRDSSGCPAGGPISCQDTTGQSGSCCFESPGGLLLQTQFWDTSGPGTALPQNWTVHGLWPDNCDGSFTSNCDPSRDYTDISGLVQSLGPPDLFNFMSTYWVDINGNNERFWEHEWSTHGTCYTTLQPQCLSQNSPTGMDAVDFFVTVQRLFESLPTYDFLAQGGITPDSSTSYTLDQLTSVLQTQGGVIPALNCNGNNLNQISWYFNLQGSMIDGNFIPINAPISGTCPSSGILYPPKV